MHLITSLNVGGAETMLAKVLDRLDRDRFSCEVISLTGLGPIANRIAALGIPVSALDMTPGRPDPGKIWHLVRRLHRDRFDLVQTWLYHADLLGGIAGALARVPVIWNLRHSNLERSDNKASTLRVVRACAVVSRILPRKIICGSDAARRAHEAIGYSSERLVVIQNGFDVDRFTVDPKASGQIREELGIKPSQLIAGVVARFDPQKDHGNLIAAAKIVKARMGQRVIFVLCGDGVDERNVWLSTRIADAGIGDVIQMLGRRDDVARLMPGFDFLVQSSCGEGFPNVVGEAMACGVPCVVTDVGDSAVVVDDTGFTVPPRSSAELGDAIVRMAALSGADRQALGFRARLRVQQHYDLGKVALRFAELYERETRKHA